MSGNTSISDGAGCQWWKHTGRAAETVTTYPTTGLGLSSETHTASDLFGARAVVVYGVIVTTAAADPLILSVSDSAGTPTALTGWSIPCNSVGEFVFPEPIYIDIGSFTGGVNFCATTNEAGVATIFYRELA